MYCVNASEPARCENGQAAFWYSQGCFIGCPACDHRSGRAQTDLCGLGFARDARRARLRAVEQRRARGLGGRHLPPQPVARFSAAPVADACGLAGGTPWGADAPEEGKYGTNTSFARHGDRGSGRARAAARRRGRRAALGARRRGDGLVADPEQPRRRLRSTGCARRRSR